MKKLSIFIFLFTSILVSSCGSDSQSPGAAAAPEVLPTPEMK